MDPDHQFVGGSRLDLVREVKLHGQPRSGGGADGHFVQAYPGARVHAVEAHQDAAVLPGLGNGEVPPVFAGGVRLRHVGKIQGERVGHIGVLRPSEPLELPVSRHGDGRLRIFGQVTAVGTSADGSPIARPGPGFARSCLPELPSFAATLHQWGPGLIPSMVPSCHCPHQILSCCRGEGQGEGKTCVDAGQADADAVVAGVPVQGFVGAEKFHLRHGERSGNV